VTTAGPECGPLAERASTSRSSSSSLPDNCRAEKETTIDDDVTTAFAIDRAGDAFARRAGLLVVRLFRAGLWFSAARLPALLGRNCRPERTGEPFSSWPSVSPAGAVTTVATAAIAEAAVGCDETKPRSFNSRVVLSGSSSVHESKRVG